MEKHQPNTVNSRGRDLAEFLKMSLVILVYLPISCIYIYLEELSLLDVELQEVSAPSLV